MRTEKSQGERFVEWLEGLKKGSSWTAAKAALKRSLAFEAGAYQASIPFVEPLLQRQDDDGWRREAHYLVAGLYALKDGDHVPGRSLAHALRAAKEQRNSDGIERRFLALLDADRDQIAHRLRQAVLLVEGGIDFAQLLDSLLKWFKPDRSVQARWAREFYREKEEASPEGQASSEGVTG